MAISTYGGNNFPNASANPQYFLQKDLLESAPTFECLEMACDSTTLPPNSNAFIGLRRYLTNAVDATPAPEGTNKAARTQIYEDFSGQMLRYTEMYQISAQTLMLTPFPAMKAAKTEMEKLIRLTRERVRANAAQALTQKIYNSSSVSTVGGVNGPITPSRLQVISRAILKAKGEYWDGIQTGTNKEGTSPTEACLYWFAHTDQQADIRALPGFIPVAGTASGKPKHRTHFGYWQNWCIFTSQEMPILTGQGASSTSLINTAGVTDVYFNLFCAKHSLTSVSLGGKGKEGFGNLGIQVLDKADKFDPTNAFADVVATWWDLCLPITNDWAYAGYFGATLNP